MKACADCYRPASATRCAPCQKRWEQSRAQRLPQRRAYKDRAYRAYREAMLTAARNGVAPLCALCGRPTRDPTVDHVVPLAQGGSNARANLRVVCRACNSGRRGAG